MDPDLLELYEEGSGEDEVAAIIRLAQPDKVPEGVRAIAQAGDILTVRMPRREIPAVKKSELTASVKAYLTPLLPDVELLEGELGGQPKEWTLRHDVHRPETLDATGKEVVMGFVGSGFDFCHPDLRNPDGSTRILALWDQSKRRGWGSPKPYEYGILHTREAIDRALASPDPYAALDYYPSDVDKTGLGAHETLVAGVAAGNGRGGGPVGVAPEAYLACVHHVPWQQDHSVPLDRSATLVEAMHFIFSLAGQRPCVINGSLGNTDGPHNWTPPVVQFMDALLQEKANRAICLSGGNYYMQCLHASGHLRPAEKRGLAWIVPGNDRTPNKLDVWYPGPDKLELELHFPGGSLAARLRPGERSSLMWGNRMVGKVYSRLAEPNFPQNEIVVRLYPGAPSGDWTVSLSGTEIVDGRFHAWIARDANPAYQSRFSPQDADPASTTGNICNGLRTIAIGAYNAHHPDEPVAPFSSSGKTPDGRFKPDLCAPGVEVCGPRSAPRGAGGASLYTRMSGTSFAAPQVAGCIALMLQVAPRPLRIEEIHNLLLGNTRKVSFLGQLADRVGSGYLDIEKAVEAARNVGGMVPELVSAGQGKEDAMIREEQEMTLEVLEDLSIEGKADEELEENAPPAVQNTYYRIASDITGAFEGGQPGTLNLYDKGIISYGRHQATLASGTLYPILQRYTELSSSTTAQKMKSYLDRVKQKDETLSLDKVFIQLLKDAAKEPEMSFAQEEGFRKEYWQGAKMKAAAAGLTSALGYALFYDTRVQGGLSADLDRTIKRLGGKVGDIANGKTITELEFLRAFTEERRHRNLRQSARDKKESEKDNREAQMLEEQADRLQVAVPATAQQLRTRVADLRRQAKRKAANAAALNISATRTRGPTWEVLIKSGNLDLSGDAKGYVYLAGKPGVAIAGLQPGATVDDATQPNPATPGKQNAEAAESLGTCPLGDGVLESDLFHEALSPFEYSGDLQVSESISLDLADLADQVVSQGTERRAPSMLLHELLARTGFFGALSTPDGGRFLSATEIFDLLVYPGHDALRSRLERFLEVVALPRSPFADLIRRGDCILRRAEGGLSHLAILATDKTWTQPEMAARGFRTESTHPGCYVEVIEGGVSPHTSEDHFARRLSDNCSRLNHDTLILRVRPDILETPQSQLISSPRNQRPGLSVALDHNDLSEGEDGRPPAGDKSDNARMDWVNMTVAEGDNPHRRVYYLTTGSPEGPAIFPLKITNENKVYRDFQDTFVLLQLQRLRQDGKTWEIVPLDKQTGKFLRIPSQNIENEDARTIPLHLSRDTLNKAYDADWPDKFLEAQFYWRDGTSFGPIMGLIPRKRYWNRKRFQFYLVSPVEVLFKQMQLKRSEHLDDPTVFQKMVPLLRDRVKVIFSHRYSTADQVPIDLQVKIGQVTSRSDMSQATGSYQLTQTAGKQISNEVATKDSVSLGIGDDLVKLGISSEFSQKINVTLINSIATQVTEAMTRSRTLTESLNLDATIPIRVDPAPPGKRRVVYIHPTFNVYSVPLIRFDGPNQYGQATRRTRIDNFPLWIPSGWKYRSAIED